MAQGTRRISLRLISMARADIRIRVRPSVIRVRIRQTAVRAVVRITAPKDQLLFPSTNRPPLSGAPRDPLFENVTLWTGFVIHCNSKN